MEGKDFGLGSGRKDIEVVMKDLGLTEDDLDDMVYEKEGRATTRGDHVDGSGKGYNKTLSQF